MTIKANAKDWKALISCAKLYTDEATIRVADGKARILEADLPKNHMIYGEIACEGEGVFSVGLEKFQKALSAVGEDPVMEVGDGTMTIHGQSARVKVPLVYREVEMKWPEKFNNATASCDISPAILDPVISYGKFCDQAVVRFIIDDTKMKVEVGQEPNVSVIESTSTAVGSATSCFGLDFIEILVKHVKAYPTMTVEGFNDNFPMIFSWHNEDTGFFKVLIAPRIDEEV